MFNKIDRSKWKREEYFNHYFSQIPCTYSITAKVDITMLKKEHLSLYPTMLYLITTIVNRHEEFRTAIDKDGNVGIFDELMPCYTIFHNETETFSNIWTIYSKDYKTFYDEYKKDLDKYGSINSMIAKVDVPENTFPVSMIPWITFEGFNLNLQKGYDYLLPIFTMGKYHMKDDKYLLPMSVQVHHSVCDGFHVSRFINELQDLINNFSLCSKM